MSEARASGRSDATRGSEFSAAIQEFLELEDEGLTKDKLLAFLKRYENRGSEFLDALKLCIKLAAAPPPEAIDEVEFILRPRRSRTDGRKG